MDIDNFLESEIGSVEKQVEVQIEKPAEKAEKIIEGKTEAPKEAKIDLKADIDSLLKTTQDYLNKKNFEAARKILLELKERKKSLPMEIKEKERKINKAIIQVNDWIVSSMDKSLSTDFDFKYSKIMQSLNQSAPLIKEGGIIQSKKDLLSVEDSYNQVKDIYMDLPDGFMQKRMDLQERMLNLYKTIIANKKTIYTSEFEEKSKKILSLMDDMEKPIKEGNLELANKKFDEVGTLYSSLPEGFLKEKTDLQRKILDIYQRLIMSRENVTTIDFSAKQNSMGLLMDKTRNLINQGDVSKAKEAYNQLTDLYSTIPSGFFTERVKLEEEMLELHRLITIASDKVSITDLKNKTEKIVNLVNVVEGHLKEGHIDLAKEAYSEIIDVYNSLPEGYMDTNIRIQNRITNLYKEIISNIGKPSQDADAVTRRKYEEVIKLLGQIHESIRKREFGEIKNKYLYVYKLYHELPIGFLEQKTELYKEVYKIYEELQLYTEIDRLAEHASAGEYDKLKASLEVITNTHAKLAKKYPEDIELFRHAKEKYLIYLNLLTQYTKPVKSGGEVRQRIEKVAKEKDLPFMPTPGRLVKEVQEKHDVHTVEDESKAYLEERFH